MLQIGTMADICVMSVSAEMKAHKEAFHNEYSE